jgi:hypothetical protein
MTATVQEIKHEVRDSGGYTRDGKPFEDHVYKVRWSSPDHYPIASVGKSSGGITVPYWHSVHPFLAYMYAVEISVEKDEEKPNWTIVKVRFEPPVLNDPFVGTATENLYNKTVVVQTQESVEQINADAYGQAIKNSANCIYDVSLQETFYDEVITIAFKANASGFNPDRLSQYRGWINDRALTMTIGSWSKTFETYTCKLQKVDYSTIYTPLGSPAFDCQIELGYRKNYRPDDDVINPPIANLKTYGWLRLIEDRGFQYLQSGKLVPFMDETNTAPSSVPGYLDGSGGKYDITLTGKPKMNCITTCKIIDFKTTELGKI